MGVSRGFSRPPGAAVRFPALMERRCLPAALLAALTLAACGGKEPPPPSAALRATPDTLLLQPLVDVTAAEALGGGRWVVLAPEDRKVLVVEFGKKPVALGTGELDQPFQLFKAGDTLWVDDWSRRRATAWSADGKLVATLPANDQLRGALPRARDAAGQWYYELRPLPGKDGSGNRDSANILRLSAQRMDTVAQLAPYDLAEVVSEGRRRLERRLLSGQDRWGAFGDGTVWVARADKNRVDWVTPDGRVTVGRDLPDRVLPVTDNDRELFLNRFDPGLRPSVEAIPFAAIKPPFEQAVAAPDGSVWLVKNRAVGDTTRFYQVINREGRFVQEFTHPGIGRIIALTADQALVAETYAEGVRLLRFSIPK